MPLRQHKSALTEFADQTVRRADARESLGTAVEDHREKQTLLRAATETVDTLQATIGKQVSELLSDIEATQQAHNKHDRALKDLRAQLVVVATRRGTGEQKHSELNKKLAKRVHVRQTAVGTPNGSVTSGEHALGLTVPLFAAASSHYESSDPHAPRLVLLDEAFAGIDDDARVTCIGLIRDFDLDFVMTSEREWG